MVWYWVRLVVDFVFDLFTVRWNTPDKDLEILLLRQQLRVLERRLGQRPCLSRWERCAGRPARPTEANDRAFASTARQDLDFQTAEPS